jgi:transposase
MSISPFWLGIDVSKRTLDLSDDKTLHRCIGNTAAAIAALMDELRGQPVRVIFEATGSYDRRLQQALADADIGFVRVNPARARDFARAAGFLAKTDAVDARMLAEMGRRMDLTETALESAERHRLIGLNRRRDQLVDMRQQERIRQAEELDDDSLAGIQRHLAWLDTEVRQLDKAIAAHLATHAMLDHVNQRLRSIPGVGAVVATTLMALMPELGHRPARTIAALAGLAPFNADSGRMRGQRHIRGGRARVRRALYMAAVTAIRTNSRFATNYRMLRQRGKPAKVALIAIARKILVTANAIIKTDKPFHA